MAVENAVTLATNPSQRPQPSKFSSVPARRVHLVLMTSSAVVPIPAKANHASVKGTGKTNAIGIGTAKVAASAMRPMTPADVAI
jgi:hypothetical protein